MADAARRLAFPVLVIISEVVLQLTGYQNIPLAIGLGAFGAVWGLWAFLTWEPIRRSIMGLRYRLATIIAPKGKRQEYSLTSGLSGNKTGAEGWAFYPNRTLLTKQCGTLEKQLQDIGANTVWVSWWVGRIARG